MERQALSIVVTMEGTRPILAEVQALGDADHVYKCQADNDSD